jgi:shikimate dehydrogenase
MMQLGILGDPLGHTLSPKLHRFLLEATGLEGTYQPFPTPPAAFERTLTALQAQGFRGVNITLPHKVNAFFWGTRHTPQAQAMRAVNTLRFEYDHLATGHNTDGLGFWRSLPAAVQAQVVGQRVVVIGAGGAARSVIYTLLAQGVAELVLAVRNPAKASNFREDRVTVVPLEALSLQHAALVVQTTPVGMATAEDPAPTASPIPLALLDQLPAQAHVIDLIYKPLDTPLVLAAKARGISAQGGLGMLVYQGVEAFEFWTGKPIAPDIAAQAYTLLED